MALLALLAMVMQVALTAEHLGATAARAAGAGGGLGFMQICTGAGVVSIPVGGASGSSHQTVSICAICTHAAAQNLTDDAADPIAVPMALSTPRRLTRRAARPLPVAGRMGTRHPIRAPPLVLRRA